VPVAGLTSSITSLVGDHGVYAVFGLMIVAAVLPAASELTMLYAGALAAGAFESAHVVAFGHQIDNHTTAYVVMALAGTAGNVVGAVCGWLLGMYAGIGLERKGRVFHVTPARLQRAERWFDRFGDVAVPVGFVTPGIRSFVAIPAGIGRMPLARFLPLTVIGCAVFCFGLAGIGWAVGASYKSVHRYLDYAIVVAIVLLLIYALVRWRGSTRLRRRAPDSAG
jgi:membrane protein DedA with SNARE-associated domain